ncbi:NADH:flavin oxidoreductase/NADH oxidase [Apilactobacillus apisilvae]|uniref:NADH:flavin oxidoreductase/NADH oxidase n=1 Tax=Apilactobacillus apisilvae TaxID=2923364 RepID=A0ABY4PH31_9LACO|nr:NADH:flavin oxidoreductase/NADH oxidase [Apilactobacillus apisilvae]UQS84887.1 NADH:flavin oxidoreductase/NADH oxidase [Apilactobacillus apisilvae]
MSLLLSKANIGGLDLKNRVAMSPMCMYEVKNEDGILTPFHFAHYGMRAIGQVGLIITESTAVDPEGRITKNDLGLWNDEQANKFKELVDSIHYLGSKIGVQLNHAGRKASDAKHPVAPSSFDFSDNYRIPEELEVSQIHQIVKKFGQAAKRANDAGVDMVEIHGAHGYLLHQFLSAVANKRNDEYGGSLENRYRIVQEVIDAVKDNYEGPVWIRLSLSDYDTTGTQNTMSEWQQVSRWLEADGINLIDVSTGGLTDDAPDFPVHDGYQTKFASQIKQAVKIPVSTVGLLDNPGLCEYILQNNQADLIMEGRALLRNTNWLADAANDLHDHDFKVFNDSYKRGQK